MKHTLSLCMLLIAFTSIYAQHTIKLAIKNSEENEEPLSGATATIASLNKTVIADSSGIATFQDIPAGTYQIKASHVGFDEQQITITVPQPTDEPIQIVLKEAEKDEG